MIKSRKVLKVRELNKKNKTIVINYIAFFVIFTKCTKEMILNGELSILDRVGRNDSKLPPNDDKVAPKWFSIISFLG